ncbi:hypothetical protein E2C01_019077 [Portunus trituberculatus]|uniref:Uncharacterized protein n=1 Tax=Portunus trituberculatus TaxID=210409 RepID=A0A5B7DYA5_PORTR|nr:hypothetical protein [Portunus trituberculatus]
MLQEIIRTSSSPSASLNQAPTATLRLPDLISLPVPPGVVPRIKVEVRRLDSRADLRWSGLVTLSGRAAAPRPPPAPTLCPPPCPLTAAGDSPGPASSQLTAGGLGATLAVAVTIFTTPLCRPPAAVASG